MAEKRKRDPSDDDDNHHKRTKKTKKGFNVGPANLPEGAYKKRSVPVDQTHLSPFTVANTTPQTKR